MIEKILKLSIILILFVFSFIFSGSEVSIFSISEIERLKLSHDKNRKNTLILAFLNHPEKVLITILVGNIVANLSVSIIGEQLSNTVFANNALFYSVFIITFLVLLFGEIIPKNIAASKPVSFAKTFIRVIDISHRLFYPINFIINKIINRGSNFKKDFNLSKDELISAVDVSSEAGLDTGSIEILKNLIGLIDRPVTDLMVPRAGIKAVDIGDYWDCIEKFIKSSLHSTIIFYRENIDNIIGYSNKINLINVNKKHLTTILKEPLFIPESKTILPLLSEYKKCKTYIAVILDEYGGTAGIITVKDILDYVFIKDLLVKHFIRKGGKDTWIITGDTKITDINSSFKISLPTESNTISGYIINLIGEIPKQGSTLDLLHNICITILKSNKKQIDLMELKKIDR